MRLVLIAATTGLLLLPLNSNADQERFTDNHSWKAGIEISRFSVSRYGSVSSDGAQLSRPEDDTTTAATGLFAAAKLSRSLWLSGGYRMMPEIAKESCDLLDATNCRDQSYSTTQYWAAIGYHIYPSLGNFTMEYGLHIGAAETIVDSVISKTVVDYLLIRGTLTVPVTDHWLIGAHAEPFGALLSVTDQDLSTSLVGLNASYLF